MRGCFGTQEIEAWMFTGLNLRRLHKKSTLGRYNGFCVRQVNSVFIVFNAINAMEEVEQQFTSSKSFSQVLMAKDFRSEGNVWG